MQDVRDKIAHGAPGLPARRQGAAGHPRRQREPGSRSSRSRCMSPTTTLRELTSLTDQTIVKALENVPGVARIDVNGRVTRQILVQIKPNALTALGIGVDQVMNAIRDGEPGRARRPPDARAERLDRARRGQDQGPGAVRPHHRRAAGRRRRSTCRRSPTSSTARRRRRSIARINGRPSITIDIQKAQDANIVETGRGVQRGGRGAARSGCPPTSSSASSTRRPTRSRRASTA